MLEQPQYTTVHDDGPLLRFGLRQLLLFVTAASVLLAAIASVSRLAGFVMVLGALVVTMHVLATSLGGRLRAQADRRNRFERSDNLPIASIASVVERHARMAAVQSGPRSPWHARGSTFLPWLRKFVISAAASGAAVGATYLAITIGYRTSPAGVVVGGVSLAVLFGWFAFLLGSFYGVFRHGFRDAVAAEQREIDADRIGRPRPDGPAI